jgi:hypothetical protein
MAGKMRAVVIEGRRTIDGIKASARARGPWVTAGRTLEVAAGQLMFPLLRRRNAGRTFQVGGRSLPYTMARFNNTFKNERCVEVSLAADFLAGVSGRVLEVGNVLSNYGIRTSDVLDKYERLPGIINQDIVGYEPDEPFDAVVSISTLEHVGWDEVPRQPERVRSAFDAVIRSAGTTGSVLISTPLGYNTELDDFLVSDPPPLMNHCLIRTSRQNDWEEAEIADGVRLTYNLRYPNANALYVGWRRFD